MRDVIGRSWQTGTIQLDFQQPRRFGCEYISGAAGQPRTAPCVPPRLRPGSLSTLCPGKQMAIDADLNAGLIDEAEARRRRQAIAREAEFYGAMDGAARFNQRDVWATILITGHQHRRRSIDRNPAAGHRSPPRPVLDTGGFHHKDEGNIIREDKFHKPSQEEFESSL